jgi:transcription elongation factor Elf1
MLELEMNSVDLEPRLRQVQEVDMTRTVCTSCGEGTYRETLFFDDMDGVLHCEICNHETKRWQKPITTGEPVYVTSFDLTKVVVADDLIYKEPPRVVHLKVEPYDVYIGRPSIWGNPYSHKSDTLAEFKVSSREEAVECYRTWFPKQEGALEAVKDLRGQILGCWCKPKACHGDVLLELANAEKEE